MFRLRVALPFVILSSALLSGCGGGGGSNGAASGSNKYVLNDNVVELDKTSATVSSVTADTVVMTGAPALSAGQILIHNAEDETRFLRKVVGVTVAGGTTTVTTTDAEAADVFKSASIDQTVELSSADLVKMQPADDGVTITKDDGSASNGLARRGTSVNKVSFNLVNFKIKDGQGRALVTVNGKVSFGAGLQTVWRQQFLHPLPDEAGIAGLAQGSANLTAVAGATGTFEREVPLTLPLRIPVTPLGPLGVNLGIQMMLRAKGSYTAGGQFVVSASIDAKTGVHYVYGSGWDTSKYNSFSKSLSIVPPRIAATADFGVSLVRPKISADILGLGEAHVTADAVDVIAHVQGVAVPSPGVDIQAQGQFGFTVGGSLHIGPFTLWSDERDVDFGRFNFGNPVFVASNGGGTDPTFIRF